MLAASLGNMIAGPLGALAFTAGAFFIGKKTNFRNPGAAFNRQQGIYAIGLVVLCAKLAKADLIGLPHQVIIGPRGIKNKLFDIKDRKSGDVSKLSYNELLNFLNIK